MDRIQDFLVAVESEIAMESFGEKIKLVSLKVASPFKSFIAGLKQKLQSLRRKKQDDEDSETEPATELFGFGKKTSKHGRDLAYDWLADNSAALAKKYPVSGKDVFIDLNDDSTESKLALALSNTMKQNDAWEHQIPLMTLQMTTGKDRTLVAMLRADWESMDVVSAGYVTLMFNDGKLTDLAKRYKAGEPLGKFDVTMWYHEIWNVTNPDEVADKKAMPLCSGTFED